ncbi:MAG: DUF4974 domain-containing protein [Bacteroidetes bacterium]|jgi:ferric-dicitrate binding protein FerR (iron transport regulator)|nr:DUF4974 domain-containing protein [Bacteroidota bacterium]
MPMPSYSIDDLLASASFVAWVEGHASNEETAFWEAWVARDPEHARRAREARALIQGLAFEAAPLPDVEAEWRRLRPRLAASQTPRPDRAPRALQRRRGTLSVAAMALAVAVLVGIGLAWWSASQESSPTFRTLTTGVAETATVTLPDSSTVVLNAQSTLRYPARWSPDAPRRVTLEGEAFFDVRHRTDASPFRVATTDGTVEVLGTQFTVRRRGQRTLVCLNEGRVAVRATSPSGAATASTTLRPGELAEFHQADTRIATRTVNPAVYSSWTTDVLVFDDTPVAEIAERITATYGVPVVVQDSTVLGKTLSGSIENHDLDVLLRALQQTLDRPVRHTDDAVRIGYR